MTDIKSDVREELAKISDVSFGCRDTGKPVLSFEVTMLNGSALQVFEAEKALKIIEENQIGDIQEINRKLAVVKISGNKVEFDRFFEK